MLAGLLAFAFAAAFTGAALYIVLVEQPARMSLDDNSLVREWAPSDRRGFALLGALALAGAVAALIAFGRAGDIRWLLGALIVAASWPYFYFVVVPINNRLLSQAQPQADSRELVREWGLLEWGLVGIGLAATGVFGWNLA